MGKTVGNCSVQNLDADFMNVWRFIRERAWIIITISFLSGSTAYIGTKLFVTPMYRAEFTAYVNNRTSVVNVPSVLSNSDVQASRSLADSYVKILTGSELLMQSAEKAGLHEYTYEELLKAVSVQRQNDTEIVKVSVNMESPVNAVAFANALADIAVESTADIADGSSMKIIDSAILPDTFCAPDYIRNMVIGMLAGALLVCCILILMYFLNDTIYSEKELEKRLNLVILGSIPN